MANSGFRRRHREVIGGLAEQALERFEAGADSFLDVLDAQRTQLSAEDMLASSETTLALNVISLYKALGGGWQLQ